MCSDSRCTSGITWCAACNGHGVVNPKGKRYRIVCRAIPAWAVTHADCHGTGLRACGCTELSAVDVATLAGKSTAA